MKKLFHTQTLLFFGVVTTNFDDVDDDNIDDRPEFLIMNKDIDDIICVCVCVAFNPFG